MTALQMPLIDTRPGKHWYEISDGHIGGRKLADRHYSRKTVGARLFIGPGSKIVLLTETQDALFVWRKSDFRLDGQTGVECTIFRNEGPIRSSELIKDAMLWAFRRWPGERLFTYVDPKAVRSKNPGCCFLKAGWKRLDTTSKVNKLIILEYVGWKGTVTCRL